MKKFTPGLLQGSDGYAERVATAPTVVISLVKASAITQGTAHSNNANRFRGVEKKIMPSSAACACLPLRVCVKSFFVCILH